MENPSSDKQIEDVKEGKPSDPDFGESVRNFESALLRKVKDDVIRKTEELEDESASVNVKEQKASSHTKIEVINSSHHPLPDYASAGAAGLDVRAYLPDEPFTLKPLERKLIPTGLRISLPLGYEAQLRPRSGLALKQGITLLNSPGTIDSDYRGEIKVLLVNFSDKNATITDGTRIAQLVLAQHAYIEWKEVENLDPSSRDQGGFGSTGLR